MHTHARRAHAHRARVAQPRPPAPACSVRFYPPSEARTSLNDCSDAAMHANRSRRHGPRTSTHTASRDRHVTAPPPPPPRGTPRTAHRHADLKSTHPIAHAAPLTDCAQLAGARLHSRAIKPRARRRRRRPARAQAVWRQIAFHPGAGATHCGWRRSLPPPASGTLKAPSPSTRP